MYDILDSIARWFATLPASAQHGFVLVLALAGGATVIVAVEVRGLCCAPQAARCETGWRRAVSAFCGAPAVVFWPGLVLPVAGALGLAGAAAALGVVRDLGIESYIGRRAGGSAMVAFTAGALAVPWLLVSLIRLRSALTPRARAPQS